MTDEIEELVHVISAENQLQNKYLKKFLPSLSQDETDSLRRLIRFYMSLGQSIEEIGKCYLLFIQVVMEETQYFIEHGTYRYSTFNEVSDDVYFNKEYMTKYMTGLGLSTYLLNFHLDSMRFFDSFIRGVHGRRYLEIGPGHGEYFVKAIKLSDLEFFHAVDLSAASVEMTRKYTQFCSLGGGI